MTMAIIGGIIILLASFAFYLASPNRKVALEHNKTRLLNSLGTIGLIIGLALILTWSGSASSVFIATTLVMLVLTIIPLFIAWRGAKVEKSK